MSDDTFVPCDAVTTIEVVNGHVSTVVCGLRKGHAGLHYDKTCGASWDPAPDAARQPEPKMGFSNATEVYKAVENYGGTETSKNLTDSLIDLRFSSYDEIVDEKKETIRALRACIEAMMPYVPDTAVGKLITRLALALIDLTQAEMPQ